MPEVFLSNNAIRTINSRPLGVCFGQCTFFAKISKERDCVKTDATSIQSNATAAQALFVIDSGNYQKSRDRIFALHGLKGGAMTKCAFGASALTSLLASGCKGKTVFIDVKLPAGFHVVAARLKSDDQWEYFDPNDGLFRESSMDDFKTILTNNFARFNYTTTGYYVVS